MNMSEQQQQQQQQQHHDNDEDNVEQEQQSEKKEKKMKSKSKKSKSRSTSKSKPSTTKTKAVTKSKKEKKSIQVEYDDDDDDQQQQQQEDITVDSPQQKVKKEKTRKKKKSKDSTTTIKSTANEVVSIVIPVEDNNEEKATKRKKKSNKNKSKKKSSNNTAAITAAITDDIVTVPSLTLADDMTTDDIDGKKTVTMEKKTKKKTKQLLDYVDPSAKPSLEGSGGLSSSRRQRQQLLDYVDPSTKPSLGGSDGLSSSRIQRQRTRRRSSLFSENLTAFGARFVSLGKRTLYVSSGQTDNFRITKNPHSMKIQRMEAYFYNHGMGIALYVLFVSLQLLVGFHGAYQFTEMGGYYTEDPILKVTLPIARAGGRLVTLNCAILLLTACKYCWTLCRTYIVPIIPIGFPIDHIMPGYHRTVALWIIVFGLVVHTLPQIVNYSTKAIVLEPQFRLWTFGNGFATTQLLTTGTLLAIIFSTFYVTTLPIIRKTAGT